MYLYLPSAVTVEAAVIEAAPKKSALADAVTIDSVLLDACAERIAPADTVRVEIASMLAWNGVTLCPVAVTLLEAEIEAAALTNV
tara:strand:+ start:438 stop:692 length:255 start_codon:yes stop_codon:yes gene_type:complete